MDSTSTKASPKSQVSECTTKIDKGKKLYTDRLDYVHNTLDGRNTRYRFDLEDDIPWLHLAEEGSFVPRELFEKFDIDCNSLDEQPGAYELLQWATGLAICRTFEILETGLIQFCTEQEQSLQQTSSISSLCEEEEKHIQLFRRYARYLEQQQPQHLDAFNRSFDHSITYLTALFAEKQQKTLHGKIWLDSLVFEPFTVYLSAALESANEKIQPVWRQAHRMHAREEAQHILTIGTYYDALNLTKVERQELAADFSAEVARGFDHLFAIAAPLAVVEEVYPDLNLSPREAGKIPCAFAQEICTSRYFKAMRTALPEMATTLKNCKAEKTTRTQPLKPVVSTARKTAGQPDIVFILSSERSGCTLLRTMLSVHPDLFSPPEMNLLCFNTMKERQKKLPLEQQYGFDYAVVTLGKLNSQLAREQVEKSERVDRDILSIYDELIADCGERILIDQSPMYSRDQSALLKAESFFGKRARYIYLSRHPVSVIDSSVRSGLQGLIQNEQAKQTDPHQLSEMRWTDSNRTVIKFLAEIDTKRWLHVRYEDLVTDPEAALTRISNKLAIPFDEKILDPYQHAEFLDESVPGSLLGDRNFRLRNRIEPDLATAWQRIVLPKPLGPEAIGVASSLGYSLVETRVKSNTSSSPEPWNRERLSGFLKEIVSEAAQIPGSEVTPATEFLELGLDSINLIKLSSLLETRLNLTLSAVTLYDYPDIGSLTEYLEQRLAADSEQEGQSTTRAGGFVARSSNATSSKSINLENEVVLGEALESSIAVAPELQVATSPDVVLTGASGFLGAYLLEGLLESTEANVFCIVRATDAVAAIQRLQKNMQRYGLWKEQYVKRVRGIPGDLAKPRFGLTDHEWESLADQTGAIYHNGALLRFDVDYAELKPTNVDSTRDVLLLATTKRLKPVYYISTMSVFDSEKHRNTAVNEDTVLDCAKGMHLGYTQTKWVSEKLVRLAGARGVPVTVFRCAGVAGDSRTGAWNTNDIICRLLKGVILQQQAPRLPFKLDMVPVDHIAKSILSLVVEVSESWNANPAMRETRTFHLNHTAPISWDQIFSWLQFQGYHLERIEFEDWINRIDSTVRDESHPVLTLIPYLAKRDVNGDHLALKSRIEQAEIDNRATNQILEKTQEQCPAIDHKLLDVWFSRMQADGFIPRPC